MSNGLNWQGISEVGATPPDTTGAIGPAHYVEATNDEVRVYDRATGAQVDSIGLPAFLGVPGDDVTDPQILWDPTTQRWYFAGITFVTGSEQLLFGFSKTSDPSELDSTAWCQFAIPTTGFIDDFPKLGDDDSRIIIGANRFDEDDNFVTGKVYAIDKPPDGDTSCAAPAFTPFDESTNPELGQTFTPVPVNIADSSSSGYVVSADGGSHIDVWHVAGPAGAPTLTHDGAVPVTAFTVPANAPQAGSTNVLDTSDARLTQAVAHMDPAAGAEAIWTQHTVAGPLGRATVRWYEILAAPTPSLRQGGVVAEPGDFAFNAAISPTIDGSSAVLNYNASGPSSLPRVVAVSHRADAPLGQMSPGATLAASPVALDDFGCTPPDPCRWGDYAGATPDPLDSALVWGTSEYVGSDAQWTSRNFALNVGGTGPTASFSGPDAIDSGGQASFDASSTTGSAGLAVTRFQWDLDGNGSFETDTGPDPHTAHVYPAPVVVTVRLIATDAAGDQSVAERSLTIRNRPPTAAFTLASALIPTGRSASLDASGSADPDGHVVRYQWDLDGDGSFETDTGSSPAATTSPFTTPAMLQLHLRVTDDQGATGEAARPLLVVKPPPTKSCLAARARVAKYAKSVRKLKRLTRRAHGARKRRYAKKLRTERRRLANARVRVHTVC